MNHFPNGVFQNCRTILVREREIEREKIRKAKRMKKAQNALRSKSNVSMIVPVDYSVEQEWDGGVTIRSTMSAPVLSSIDPFDVAWSQALSGTAGAGTRNRTGIRTGGELLFTPQSDQLENGESEGEEDV
jgi:hypothetical protein